ncbi:unnamed protein product [Owenia fusiformis]|uniref:Shisa N-terminal domain-containing protein n=1 Tax=Owenia fusiformis TaxID=6347 RepID=A0A8J1TH90_OWEFU|nr:unnamed protein product [Owenia fusiformis]
MIAMSSCVIYRGCVLLICCIGLVHGLEYCTSYCDRRGAWHPGFVCGMFIKPPVAQKGTVALKETVQRHGTNTTLYCCGTQSFRFCCNDPDSSIAGLYPERYHCVRNMSHRWRIVLGVFTAIIILLTCGMCCFFGCSKAQFTATRSRTMASRTRQDTNNNSQATIRANGGITEHEEIILSAGPVPEFNYPIYQPPAYHEIAGDPPPFTEQSQTSQITPNSAATTVRVSHNAAVSGLVVAVDTTSNSSVVNTSANKNQTTTHATGCVTAESETPMCVPTTTTLSYNAANSRRQTTYDNACAIPLPAIPSEIENVATRGITNESALEATSGSNAEQQSNGDLTKLPDDSSTVTNVTNRVNQAKTTAVHNLKDNASPSSLSQPIAGSHNQNKPQSNRKTVSFDNAAFQIDK